MPNLTVVGLFTLNYLLNVLFAFLQVLGKLLEILQEQVSVREEFLVIELLLEVVLVNLGLSIQNCHRIEVILTIEQDIESCSLNILKVKSVWHLTEEWAVLEEERVEAHDLKGR